MHLPSEPNFHHFKNQCICCEESGKKMNKEHIFPKWLLKLTNTEQDLFNSPNGMVPGISLTIPLCEDCNRQLGVELEAPVSSIFLRINNNEGFNDHEAELLVRWMWKINGMFYWSICNENWKYGYITLKEHVLSKIVSPRDRISIAISLIKYPEDEYGCAAVGLDAFPLYSNIYSVGVFSKICLVVFHSQFSDYFDRKIWTVYKLSNVPMVINPKHKIYPKYGFHKRSEAISYVQTHFDNDSQIFQNHEYLALNNKELINNIIHYK